MTGLRVGDVLKSRRVVAMRPHLPVSEAAKRMRSFNVTAVMVVQDGQLIGVLTERDLVTRVVADGRDIDRTPVERVMTRSPIFVEPDTPIESAVRTMRELRLRHLPVVDPSVEPGRQNLIGILSARDVLGQNVDDIAPPATDPAEIA